MAKKSAS